MKNRNRNPSSFSSNVPIAYSAESVIAWLEKVRPNIPWRSMVGDKLPPVIWRSRWNNLRDNLGLPYSAGMMANLDSEGRGPERLEPPQ